MPPYLFGFLLSRLVRLICVFLNSHPLFRCRCVVEVRLLPDLSVLAHIFRLSRTCQIQLVFRYLPAFLHRLHHRHHRRYRFLPTYCFGRFLVCCSGCPEGFHPIGRTSRPGLVGSVGFWDLFLRLCFGPVLFCSFFRSEIMFRNKCSVNYFSGVRFYGTFDSAYSGLEYVSEFSFH